MAELQAERDAKAGRTSSLGGDLAATETAVEAEQTTGKDEQPQPASAEEQEAAEEKEKKMPKVID